MASRKKPCEMCEDEQFDILEGCNNHNLHIEIYPDNGIIAIASYAENPNSGELDEITAEIPMKYCPNCGRKLEG